jgi:hypothetical protein
MMVCSAAVMLLYVCVGILVNYGVTVTLRQRSKCGQPSSMAGSDCLLVPAGSTCLGVKDHAASCSHSTFEHLHGKSSAGVCHTGAALQVATLCSCGPFEDLAACLPPWQVGCTHFADIQCASGWPPA